MPRDTRPLGTQIDSAGAMRAIQVALEEKGYSEEVMFATTNNVKDKQFSVLTITVQDSVKDRDVLDHLLEEMVNYLVLRGNTLFYEDPERGQELRAA